jgi:hypothetical protein
MNPTDQRGTFLCPGKNLIQFFLCFIDLFINTFPHLWDFQGEDQGTGHLVAQALHEGFNCHQFGSSSLQ